MSDSDSDDGFDKEAEKERLREQLRADERKRQATQRMSDLLLRGATMTNNHCDVCGDPLFRYEGQTFCPSCQGEISDDSDDHPADESDMIAPGTEEEATVDEEPDRVASSPTASDAPDVPPVEKQLSGGELSDSAQPDDSSANRPRADSEDDRSTTVDDVAHSVHREPAESAQRAESSRDAARSSLERTLTSLARRAEAADDPRQARELLAAAREAAEALAALDGRR